VLGKKKNKKKKIHSQPNGSFEYNEKREKKKTKDIRSENNKKGKILPTGTAQSVLAIGRQ